MVILQAWNTVNKNYAIVTQDLIVVRYTPKRLCKNTMLSIKMLHCTVKPLNFVITCMYCCDITQRKSNFIRIRKQPDSWNCPDKRCTNPLRHVAVANKSSAVTPNTYGSSVWNSQHATLLASKIFRYLLGVWKFVHPWIERNFSTSWTDSYRKISRRNICPKHAKPCGTNMCVSSLLLHIIPSSLRFQTPSGYITSVSIILDVAL
jgi:hypothetical protein